LKNGDKLPEPESEIGSMIETLNIPSINASAESLGKFSSPLAKVLDDIPVDMLLAINLDADPCADFYDYACGRWNRENQVNLTADAYRKSVKFVYDIAEKRSRERLNELLKVDKGPAGIMFRSCMDVERIE
jgi:hypothetical protein